MWSKFFQLLSLLLLISIWIYTGLNFNKLPETIAIHFDLQGNADGFGSRNLLWFLCAVSTALFLFLYYISKNINSPLLSIPNSLRNNKKLTELFVSVLLFQTMLLFANITFETVKIGLGKAKALSYNTEILMFLIFAVMSGFFIYAPKLQKKKNVES